jgi:hypothetical protein
LASQCPCQTLLGLYSQDSSAEILGEAFIIPHVAHDAERIDIGCSTETGTWDLRYPDPPFPADLCKDISNLPRGFQQLAVARRLSREVVRLVIISSRQGVFDTKEVVNQPTLCCPSMTVLLARKFAEASVRITESLVCRSIIIAAMRSVSFPLGMEDLQLIQEFAYLATERAAEENGDDEFNFYVWAVIMAAEACRHVPALSAITSKILADLLAPVARKEPRAPEFLADWSKLEQLLKKYLWTQDLLSEWKNMWQQTLDELRPSTPSLSQG